MSSLPSGPGWADSPPARAPAIVIRDLDFQVGHSGHRQQSLPILQGVTLSVETEEFVSIVGPSGCGKSTLLNFIAGLNDVQSGQIAITQRSPGTPGSLGYMFQQHGLLPWRNVLDNVALGLEIAGEAPVSRHEKARRSLAIIGAIVGEFISARAGIGYMMDEAAGGFDTTGMLMPLVVLMLVSFALDRGILAASRRFLHWHLPAR